MNAPELEAAIKDGRVKTRAQAGHEYAGVIHEYMRTHAPDDGTSDATVASLNDAIVSRWSRSGLDWIKKRGWAVATGRA